MFRLKYSIQNTDLMTLFIIKNKLVYFVNMKYIQKSNIIFEFCIPLEYD